MWWRSVLWAIVLTVLSSIWAQPTPAGESVVLTPEERAWLDAHPDIVLGSPATFPPLLIRRSDGSFTGVVVDYVEELNRHLGTKIRLQVDDSLQAIGDKAKNREVDGLVPAVDSPAWTSHFNSTAPLFPTYFYFFARHGEVGRFTRLSDLAGLRVGYRRASSGVESILAKNPKIIGAPFDDDEAMTQALLLKNVDVIIASSSFEYWRKTSLQGTVEIGTFAEARAFDRVTLIRKDWPELIPILNKGIARIGKDGFVRILDKWFGQLPRPSESKDILTPAEREWLKAHPDIRLGFTSAMRPILVQRENGALIGIYPDVMKRLEELLDIKVKIEVHPWPQIPALLKQGRLDGMLAAQGVYAKNVGLLQTTGVLPDMPTFFVHKGAPFKLNGYEDLKNKKVSYMKGMILIDQLIEPYRDDIELIMADSILDSLTMLREGKVDVAIASAVSNYFLVEHVMHNIEPIHYDMEHRGVTAPAIRSDWPEFVTILNKGLAALGEEEINTIITKWVGFTMPSPAISLTAQERKWLIEHPIIRVAGNPAWTPVEFVDENKAFKGLSVDYLTRISEMLGVRFEFDRKSDWKGAIEKVRNRDLDMFSAAGVTPEYEKFATFTDPYLSLQNAIFTRDDAPYVSALSELKGRKISIIKGYRVTEQLKRAHPDLNFVEVANIPEGLKKLEKKEVDAHIGNILVTGHYIRQDTFTNIKVTGFVPDKNDVAMAVRSDWPIFAEILQKALKAIPQDDRAAMYDRWVGLQIETPIDYTIVWQVLFVSVMILLVIVYWNRRLAKEVMQRKQAEVAAKAANRAKSTFLANMSHELRTPLNAILGFSKLMGRDPAIASSQKKKLSIINRSGEHLLDMINDVLDLSKIEAGRLDLEPEAFDLPQMLHDLSRMFELRAEGSDLLFDLELDPSLAHYIKIDGGKLHQVLINLLGNAVKFTTEGGIIMRARTQPFETDPTMATLQLEVEDSGTGIAPEQLERIFEPFVQVAHSKTNAMGSGLGLAITKSCIDLLGGNISVESKLGKGSLFRVDLPVALVEATDVSAIGKAKAEVVGLEPGQLAWRILVVEDNLENQLLLSSLLSEVGFEVREAENGTEAIVQFEQWQPHFIWMDMRMPVMDGYAATAKIRSLPGGDKVRIVAFTASAFKEQEESIIASGCDDVLHKPCRDYELFNMMARHIDVKFTYEEPGEFMPPIVPPRPDDVTKLQLELVEQMHDAVRDCNSKAMQDAIERVPEDHADLADTLQRMLDAFDWNGIEVFLGERDD